MNTEKKLEKWGLTVDQASVLERWSTAVEVQAAAFKALQNAENELLNRRVEMCQTFGPDGLNPFDLKIFAGGGIIRIYRNEQGLETAFWDQPPKTNES